MSSCGIRGLVTRIAALGVLTLAACAAPMPKTVQPVDTVAPRCAAGIQCDRQWLAAQDTLQNITGMRLRIVTDTRLETFAATGYGRMGGQVVKYPVDSATFELRVQLECYRGTECEDLRNTGTNLFNRAVASAK